jgi:hypothetical protein
MKNERTKILCNDLGFAYIYTVDQVIKRIYHIINFIQDSQFIDIK